MKKLNLYVVPHTHIDVQWYYTYETFRTTLAKRIFRDHLLPLMRKDPGYCFSQDQVRSAHHLQSKGKANLPSSHWCWQIWEKTEFMASLIILSVPPRR